MRVALSRRSFTQGLGLVLAFALDPAAAQQRQLPGSLGGNLLPPVPTSAALSADLSLKGWVWTAVAEYAALEDRKAPLDVFGGFRYLTMTNKLSWQFTGNIGSIPPVQQAGSTSSSGSLWDAIVGVKGRLRFGDGGWFLPYYLDVGTGQSKSTLQALVGVGYAFSWGDVVADYRRLDYHMPEGEMLSDISLKGGLVGVVLIHIPRSVWSNSLVCASVTFCS